MRTREFNMEIENFDLSYDDDLNKNLIEEFIIEDLEVPRDYIKSLNIYDNYVNIKLDAKQRYFNEDWYVNLQRMVS